MQLKKLDQKVIETAVAHNERLKVLNLVAGNEYELVSVIKNYTHNGKPAVGYIV